MRHPILFAKQDGGAVAIEYSLIAAFVALALVGAFATLGADYIELYERITAAVTKAMS